MILKRPIPKLNNPIIRNQTILQGSWKAKIIDEAEKRVNIIYEKEPKPENKKMTKAFLSLYRKILKDSHGETLRGIDDFHFLQMIEKSPCNIKNWRSFNLLRLQYNIYCLAKKWDKQVNDDRIKKGQLPGKHMFFLTYWREHDHRTFYVKTFNGYMPPDRRLVAISIPKRIYIDYMPILHEMGHVIGCRRRDDRREPLFKFVLLSILQEIFHECMSAYDGITFGTPYEIPILDDYNTMGFYESKWWQYGRGIIADLNIIYDKIVEVIGQETDEKEDQISYADDFVSKKRTQIVCILENDVIWNDLKYANQLKTAYLAVKKHDSLPFLSVCDYVIDVFEEPVADCFMIKIGGLTLNRYLNMVFNEAWNTWKNARSMGSDESFLDYMSSDILRYRILSVCYAMIKENPEEEEALNKHACFLSNVSLRRRSINKARKMFKGLYDKHTHSIKENFTQLLLNPQEIISDYLYDYVFTNDRYKFNFSDVQDSIKNDAIENYVIKIRKIMKSKLAGFMFIK